jgi:hypothetical protein
MDCSGETPLEQTKAEEKAREIDVTPESSAQKVTEAEEA